MGHRVNERNAGNWSLNGQPKVRHRKSGKDLTNDQKSLLSQVVEKVVECLEHDKDGPGHLSPESRWIDAGNFTLSVSGAQLGELYKILEKLK